VIHATKWEKRRRFVRAAGYLAIACSGVATLTVTPPLIQYADSPIYGAYVVWLCLMVAGALFCCYGAVRGRWFGEYVGLWPIVTSLTALAVIIWTSEHWRIGSGAALLTVAFAGFLLVRWADVARLRAEALAAVREGRRRVYDGGV
jgi:hypothetical protein